MPLTLNLKQLEKQSLRFEGGIEPGEMELETLDDLVRLAGALRYAFVAERHEQGVLLQGRLEWSLDCDCARCLKAFRQERVLDPWVVHLPFEGEDAPAVVNDCVDLTPYLREDMMLELPQRPLCRADCTGVPEGAGPCGQADKDAQDWGKPEGAWQALDKLNFS